MGYPAFRLLDRFDMPSSDHRNRLSDFRCLFEKLIQSLLAIDKWSDMTDLAKINEMLDSVIHNMGIPSTTPKGRRRRV